jgi:hypothetical protein
VESCAAKVQGSKWNYGTLSVRSNAERLDAIKKYVLAKPMITKPKPIEAAVYIRTVQQSYTGA